MYIIYCISYNLYELHFRDHTFKSVHAMKNAKKIYLSMLSMMNAVMSRHKILWNRLPRLTTRNEIMSKAK